VPADRIKIQVLTHKQTGLVMAVAENLPGFVVHAHSEDELEAKLIPAFLSFLRATDQPTDGDWIVVNETVPGFSPAAFVLQPARIAA
jgi:hypothetical protein